MNSLEEARKLHWEALQRRGDLWGKPGYDEARAEEERIKEEAWRLFGNHDGQKLGHNR